MTRKRTTSDDKMKGQALRLARLVASRGRPVNTAEIQSVLMIGNDRANHIARLLVESGKVAIQPDPSNRLDPQLARWVPLPPEHAGQQERAS